MAKHVTLAVQPRTESGRTAVKKIKAEGFVPGVVYGPHQEPVHIKVNDRDLRAVLAKGAQEQILVDLDVAGASHTTIIQAVQQHPVSHNILHVDFQAVSDKELVETAIPVEPVGEANGVKNFGGILEQLRRTLRVKSLPANLPSVLQVDVTALLVGESIQIKDIKFPEGVTPVGDKSVGVFIVSGSRASATAAAAAAAEAKGGKK